MKACIGILALLLVSTVAKAQDAKGHEHGCAATPVSNGSSTLECIWIEESPDSSSTLTKGHEPQGG